MKQQQGAALVIVMALLSGALMLGMSGMQSALIDERLAGNYRASVQAQMNSDSLMSEFANTFPLDLMDRIFEDGNASYEGNSISNFLENTNNLGPLDKLRVSIDVDKENGVITIITTDQGTNNNAIRQTVATYQRGNGENSESEEGGNNGGGGGNNGGVGAAPFQTPVVGCEGVSSGGGSTISSYDSSDEDNWEDQVGIFETLDIPLIRTTAENANVVLGGNEQIHGGIEALGSVTLNGSSQVFGSILANQTINLNAGGGRVRGNAESLADIIFDSSTRVDGIVRAMRHVRLNNWSASVGEGIYAGGNVMSSRNPASDHLDQNNRANFFQRSEISLNRVEEQPCDTLNFAGNTLSEEIRRYQSELTSIGDITVGTHPNVEWRFTPQHIERYDQTWNVNRWMTHASPELNMLFGEQTPIFRMNTLNLTGSPSLRVSGGDVVIVVDGDFMMGGGGPGLVIDSDSSLTVFVSGRIDFGSVLNMPESNSINLNGEPTFSLFSGYSGAGTGVNFNSSNQVVANVYAPYATVSVNSGAGFFGSVKGRSVNVSGDGSIVYDELLVGAFGGPSSGTPGAGVSGGWRLVGWQ